MRIMMYQFCLHFQVVSQLQNITILAEYAFLQLFSGGFRATNQTNFYHST